MPDQHRFRNRAQTSRVRSRLRQWRPRLVLAGATGLIGIVAAFAIHGAATQRPLDPGAARQEIAVSLGLLRGGNYNAALSHAQTAIVADASWGLAHAVAARIELARGDGMAAEGELNRATATGFDVGRVHQLYAHAYLLEGDPRRAIAEAGRAGPVFAGYALRVAARSYAALGNAAQAQQLLQQVVDANSRNSLAWSDLGRLRFQMGDLAGATDATTRALANDHDDLEALTLRGELIRDQYGLVAALPWFEAALRRDPYYHDALIQYAATLGDAGRYTDMLDATRRALATRPGSPQALYLQAVLAARAGDFDLARSMMGEVGGRLDAVPAVMLLNGSLAYEAGAFEQAVSAWRGLVGAQPMNLVARRLLGAALLRSGDVRGALDILRPIALRGDADSYTLDLVGRAFERSGERGWAARYLDRAAYPAPAAVVPFGSDTPLPDLGEAAALAPSEPGARLDYLRGLLEHGQADGALDQAETLTRMMPGAPASWLAMGDTLVALSRPADAVAAFRRAAGIRFDEPTMLRLVDALDRDGQRPSAADVLATYMSQNPQSVAGQRLTAHWQVAAGDWNAAIDSLEALRDRVGDHDVAILADLAYAYAGADDDTALVYGRAAYRLAPMNPVAADAYGWALYQNGRNPAALQLLLKAVSIAPDHAVLRWHLAQVLTDLGQRAQATQQLRSALADPNFADRAAAAALLARIG